MRSSCVWPRSPTSARPRRPSSCRITYDGSIADEPHFVVMGGTTSLIINALKEILLENAELADAVRIAVGALRAGIASTAGSATPAAEPRVLGPATLGVAILERGRRRAFRRITGAALEELLPAEVDQKAEPKKKEAEAAKPAE